MDSTAWDARYKDSDLVWSSTPNTWVEQVAGDLPAGRVLDLAAGEGRNALWLAERGWEATAIDFSMVAVNRSRELAQQRLGDAVDRFEANQGDLLQVRPKSFAYDLVMVVYLQLSAGEMFLILRTAAQSVAPGGRLLVVAHHTDNLAEGVGGPQDPSVLYSEKDVVDDLVDTGLVIERAERALRPVQTDSGVVNAVDVVVVAKRPE